MAMPYYSIDLGSIVECGCNFCLVLHSSYKLQRLPLILSGITLKRNNMIAQSSFGLCSALYLKLNCFIIQLRMRLLEDYRTKWTGGLEVHMTD